MDFILSNEEVADLLSFAELKISKTSPFKKGFEPNESANFDDKWYITDDGINEDVLETIKTVASPLEMDIVSLLSSKRTYYVCSGENVLVIMWKMKKLSACVFKSFTDTASCIGWIDSILFAHVDKKPNLGGTAILTYPEAYCMLSGTVISSASSTDTLEEDDFYNKGFENYLSDYLLKSGFAAQSEAVKEHDTAILERLEAKGLLKNDGDNYSFTGKALGIFGNKLKETAQIASTEKDPILLLFTDKGVTKVSDKDGLIYTDCLEELDWGEIL